MYVRTEVGWKSRALSILPSPFAIWHQSPLKECFFLIHNEKHSCEHHTTIKEEIIYRTTNIVRINQEKNDDKKNKSNNEYLRNVNKA